MELELKHLAPYLPYGLMVQLSQKGIFNLDEEFPQPHNEICEITNILKCNNEWQVEISEVAGDDSFGLIDLDEIIPLLLPMSSLYTEMEDGKVPAIELAKIANPKTTWTLQPDCNFPLSNIGELFAWTIDENEFYFHLEWKDYSKHYFNQLGCFQYLFENHFDIYGLIDKGLAIDKTKIK